MARWMSRHWMWITTLGTAAVFVPLTGSTTEDRARQRNLDILAEVISLVQRQSIDPPNAKQTSQATIQGMLHTLDPHSNFFSEEDFRRMREDQHGSFFGIGATIQQRPDGVVIMGLVKGGAAEKGGVLPGDYVKEIDGKSMDGMNSNQVVQRLRGEKGTVVEVGLQRVGHEKLIQLKLTRVEVPSTSLNHAFMLRPDVGLIGIKEFTETTGREFEEAVARLQAQGMKRLILDLRGNPGGSLNAAIQVSERILGPDQLIVSQQGRDGRNHEEHRTPASKELDPFPLVILVNRGSASASEIVSGAVQDHDRGLVVGTTSWGKGLVQTSIPINRSRGLLLTTARYYTPSGRLIQRDYKHGIDDYMNVDDSPEKGEPKGPAFKTDLGRTVYGGGGITPDVRVEADRYSVFVTRIYRVGLFFRFALLEKDRDGIKADGVVTDAQMARFKTFLQEQKLPMTEADWSDAKNFKDMRDQITYEMRVLLHGQEAGYRHLVEQDNQMMKALELLPESQKLMEQRLARK